MSPLFHHDSGNIACTSPACMPCLKLWPVNPPLISTPLYPAPAVLSPLSPPPLIPPPLYPLPPPAPPPLPPFNPICAQSLLPIPQLCSTLCPPLSPCPPPANHPCPLLKLPSTTAPCVHAPCHCPSFCHAASQKFLCTLLTSRVSQDPGSFVQKNLYPFLQHNQFTWSTRSRKTGHCQSAAPCPPCFPFFAVLQLEHSKSSWFSSRHSFALCCFPQCPHTSCIDAQFAALCSPKHWHLRQHLGSCSCFLAHTFFPSTNIPFPIAWLAPSRV